MLASTVFLSLINRPVESPDAVRLGRPNALPVVTAFSSYSCATMSLKFLLNLADCELPFRTSDQPEIIHVDI
jgi:hypothetical protein